MPMKPARPCAHSGCPLLTTNKERFCDAHLKQRNKEIDERRGTPTERGYNNDWNKARLMYLRAHPLCAICKQKNPPEITAAVLVDHIIPHKGDQELFWNQSNWQSACKECHDVKTAKEDGAFGNKTQSTR